MMQRQVAPRNMKPVVRVSVTDQVFEELYSRVLALDLPPDTKISEADVSKQLGVSRQVVRDAFFRLSQLGFLVIRPQKATVVSRISVKDIMEARYIRMALEMENARQACRSFSAASIHKLDKLIESQQQAIDKGQNELFHNLDNEFHKEICIGANLEFTWATILEKKAHTDRVRFLSVAFSSQTALEGHCEILAAIKARDAEMAVAVVKNHLSQIESAIEHLRSENHAWFQDF